LLRSTPRPTALISHSDSTLLRVLAALRREGLRVPEDISVVGFDDITLARHIELPLTTVSQRIPDMAARAVELLRRKCEVAAEERPPAQIVLEPQLIIRASTANIDA
jgi:DNA-binding LacI/PurR family transcriptional regulator